ncbi:hypothetical protein [Cohaesibacter haloalkalitolerans]|uniref:hypothetical protein n=1 Tax=Cohaesibacter haloalkalitolerans TaxID=1162980 RepID=UPI000E650189|nr:hypothetical protein [Cohaesibacter haloalkalitolerans]
MTDENQLAKHHKERMEASRQSILGAMKDIEAEIDERGYYCDPEDPDKPRRLSMQEIQRRAGVSEAYLRNARHADLREDVRQWLAVQKKKTGASSKPEAEKVRRETIRYYEQTLKELATETAMWKAAHDDLVKQVERLKTQIANMSSNDGNKIVLLDPRKNK